MRAVAGAAQQADQAAHHAGELQLDLDARERRAEPRKAEVVARAAQPRLPADRVAVRLLIEQHAKRAARSRVFKHFASRLIGVDRLSVDLDLAEGH